jgi:hypothetical protein
MKRNGLILVCATLFAVVSCKEVPPFINFEPDVELLVDTSYITSPLPSPQDQNIFIEDISGVRCSNCPKAAKVAHDLLDNTPNRVVVSTIHANLLAGFTTPYKTVEYSNAMDFRTEEGTNIVRELIGEPLGLPSGALNRISFAGETQVAISERTWPGHTLDLLARKSKVNMELTVKKDTSNKTATATIKAVFTEKITDPVYLSVMITESHIISPQLFDSGVAENYEHNFVLRKSLSTHHGILLAQEITEMGKTFEKGFELEIDEAWVYKNCSIVVLVNRHGIDSKEILQVISYDLKE